MNQRTKRTLKRQRKGNDGKKRKLKQIEVRQRKLKVGNESSEGLPRRLLTPFES